MGCLLWGSDFRTEPDPRSAARRANDRRMSEKELQASVIEEMRQLGWRLIFHARPAWVGSPGSRRLITNTLPEGAGFPDLLCLRGGVVLALELKQEQKHPKPEQEAWLRGWASLPCCVAAWIRPRDRELVSDLLRRPWAYMPENPSSIPAALETGAPQ